MVVDPTNGKFHNKGRNDQWAQVNTGTTFTFPVVAGSVITFGAYNSAGTLTINGTAFASAESYTVPAGVTSVTATANGVEYMSFIKTTTPAANGKPADPAVTPTGTPEVVTPTGTPEVVTPTGTPEVVTPTGTPGAVTPTGTPEVATPTGTPGAATPTGTPEVVTPTGTPEAVTPTGTPVPELTGTVTISGDAKVGSQLTAEVTVSNATSFHYEWQANTGESDAYVKIAGSSDSSTYTITAALVGKTIKCVVTADNFTGSLKSDPTEVLPDSKWAVMNDADNATIEVVKEGSDYVDVLTVKSGYDRKFTYNLASDVDNFPATYADADGEIIVSYDLKVNSETFPGGDWFIDLSTSNTDVRGWGGGDGAVFGRFASHAEGYKKAGFVGGSHKTSESAPYTYQNNVFASNEWRTVTYKVNLKSKNVFSGQYGDDGMHTVMGYPTTLNNGKLYLNIGFGGDVSKDVVVNIKNLHVEYKTEGITTYSVTDGTVSGGTLAYSPANPRMGETVTVTGTPSETGGIITSITADDALNLTKVSDIQYTFVMPAKNVTVDATMQVAKVITVKNTITEGTNEYYEGGLISADKANAAVGETVTLTASPYFGWKLGSYKIYNEDGTTEATDVSITGNTFAMPNKNIVVKATWTSADNMQVLRFSDGVKGDDSSESNGYTGVRFDLNGKMLNYVYQGSKWKFSNVNYTNLSKIHLISQGNTNAIVSFYKGDSSSTAFGTMNDLKTGCTKYSASDTKLTADMYDTVLNVTGIDTTTNPDTLRLQWAHKDNNIEQHLNNYWYIVLEYAE